MHSHIHAITPFTPLHPPRPIFSTRYFLQVLISPTRLPSFITTLSFFFLFNSCTHLFFIAAHLPSPPPHQHPSPALLSKPIDYTSKVCTARVSLEAIPQKSKAVLSEIHPKALLWLVVVSLCRFHIQSNQSTGHILSRCPVVRAQHLKVIVHFCIAGEVIAETLQISNV